MQRPSCKVILIACLIFISLLTSNALRVEAQSSPAAPESRVSPPNGKPGPMSAEYSKVQRRLAQGWNTWDVNSVATHVLLPEGLAIHIGLKHNSTINGDEFLQDVLIGRLTPGAEQVTPGPHSWDGSYTDLRIAWKGHDWRIESARDGADLVVLVTPLASKEGSELPPTVVFTVDFLWNRPGATLKHGNFIEARTGLKTIPIYCACTNEEEGTNDVNVPVKGSYFAVDLVRPVGISTGKERTLAEIQSVIERQRAAYEQSIASAGKNGPIVDAIETTLGWDTIYEPEKQRVVSPVSRVWCVGWGGYVIFDWDTFFAATMAGIGDRDLAYANALETLREETAEGFVPNYARAGGMEELGPFANRRWARSRCWGSTTNSTTAGFLKMRLSRCCGGTAGGRSIAICTATCPGAATRRISQRIWTTRLVGTWQGAIYETGLDNSPMYDGTFYNQQTHLLEYADVGMMSLYIADCDALAEIAETLNRTEEAKELKERSARYRAKLATLWDAQAGMFLNKDLHTGQFNARLSPTNFYPMLAHAATAEQARTMIDKHLLNPQGVLGSVGDSFD